MLKEHQPVHCKNKISIKSNKNWELLAWFFSAVNSRNTETCFGADIFIHSLVYQNSFYISSFTWSIGHHCPHRQSSQHISYLGIVSLFADACYHKSMLSFRDHNCDGKNSSDIAKFPSTNITGSRPCSLCGTLNVRLLKDIFQNTSFTHLKPGRLHICISPSCLIAE